MSQPGEPNMAWAATLVDELARAGVRHAVVSPGSRSAPLALAFRRHPGMQVHVILDERSAGYFALGLAKVSGVPAAVVTTSGTAAVNLHPAAVEADLAGVPLLLVTADRPPELLDAGANQAIRQAGLFGASLRWEALLPLPSAGQRDLRHLRSTASRAVALAKDGPVHVNVPFREPLGAGAPMPSPLPVPQRPFVEVARPTLGPGTLPVDLPPGPHGVIVAGPGATMPELADLASAWQVPLVADALSGLRHASRSVEAALASPRLRASLRPDWILQVGASPTSRNVRAYLEAHADAPRWVLRGGSLRDDLGSPATFVLGPVPAILHALGQETRRGDPAWLARWNAIPHLPPQHHDWEGPAVPAILEAMGGAGLLWLGSSLPVRDADRFAAANTAGLTILSNRGASGIDGVLSAAAGAALAHAQAGAGGRAVAYVGDLTFLHDIGGLAAVARHAPHLALVVLNNQGGRIFEHLSVAGEVPRGEFEELFATPQQVDIAKACQAFGVPHVRLDGTAKLPAALEGMGGSTAGGMTRGAGAMAGGVVEVAVDPVVATRRRKEHLAGTVAAADRLVDSWEEEAAGRKREVKARVPA